MSYGAQPWLLVGYVCLFGICQGARGPIVASLSARLFAGPGLATIYGTIYACMSVGSGIGALLAGVLHDATGGYRADVRALDGVRAGRVDAVLDLRRPRPQPTDRNRENSR